MATASVALGQKPRPTVEFRHVRDKILTQSKELSMIAQLETLIKNLEKNVAFYEASDEELKSELVKKTEENTRLEELFDNMSAQLVDLQEKLAAKDAAIKSVVQESYTKFRTSLKSLINNFRVALNKPAGDAF